METIGERIKKWRKEKGLTTQEISKKTGISAGGLSEYENNKKLIGSKTLLSLYEEYKIDIQYILTGEKANTTNNVLEQSENDKEILELMHQLPEREQIKAIARIEDIVEKYKENNNIKD